MAHVDLVGQGAKGEARCARNAIGFAQQRLDVDQRLAGLSRRIADMEGLVAHDAGGSRDEQEIRGGIPKHARARKHGPRSVFRRILERGGLPGVLDGLRRGLAREEIDHQRAAKRRAKRAGRRHGTGHGASACDQRIPARLVELPIALRSVAVGVDLGEVVPDTQQVAVAHRIEDREDLPISLLRGGLQRRPRRLSR